MDKNQTNNSYYKQFVKLTLTCLLMLLRFSVISQNSPNPINGTGPYTDIYNCNDAPTFSVNLTGQPAGSWTSNPTQRVGDCCTPPDNNCVQFSVILDPAAEGIIFSIPGGCGAAPSGALFYQVNCGPLTSVGSPLCLTGTGPFIITFCKPGNNANCYSITSIPAPVSGGDVVTADGCRDTLTVSGVTQATTTWTSISPGSPGQYNNYLNNIAGTQPGVSGTLYTGQTTVIVTPQPGFPSVIQYQVCGTAIGGCSSATFCDTVSVSIFPTLFAQINPLNPTICFGSPGTLLTAVPIGGTAPYTYLWNGPSNNGATTSSILASLPGVYTLSITDVTGCPAAVTNVTVTQFVNTITANAGPDITVCRTPVPTVTVNGTVTGVTTGIWSGGAGTYSPSNTSLILNYVPSAAELAAGSVTLTLTTTNNGTCPGSSDQVLITFPQFSSTLTTIPTNISCNGMIDGSIDLTVTGGFAPTGYLWSNGSTTQDIASLVPGTYSVTVTDINGCTGVTSQIITQPAVLVSAIVTQTNVSCFGGNNGSVVIAGAGGTSAYQYSINGGPNQASGAFSGLIAGSYTVTVIDAHGCTVNQAVIITQPLAALSVSASQVNVLCFGASSGSINLTPAGGTSPYTYLWSNGATTEDLNSLPAGTYTLTMHDANGLTGGCAATTTITIIQPASQMTLNATQINVACNGGMTGSIDLTATGGTAPYTYLWSNGAATQDLNGLAVGTYTVTAHDANGLIGGCAASTTIIITQPAPLTQSLSGFTYPSGTNISCFGLSDGSVNLTIGGGTPGYTYSWSNGSLLEDPAGLPIGTYSATATDANGCTILASITLTQPPFLSTSLTPFVYPGGFNLSGCTNDGSIDLNVNGGNPGYTYSWSNGAVTQDVSSLSAGTYSVTVTDFNGCQSVSSVTLAQPFPLTQAISANIYPSGTNISCFGLSDGSIDLTITGGSPLYTYAWSNGATTQDLSNVPIGTYNVTVTDANGCQITSSITLNQPSVLTSSLVPSVYAGGFNVSGCVADGTIDLSVVGGNPIYTYSWSNGATSQDVSALIAGSYIVTVTDINGCQSLSTITLTQPGGLSQVISATTFLSGTNISCFGLSDGNVNLTIAGGTPGYTYIWNNGATSEDLSNVTAGTYGVTVTDANGCQISSSITLDQPAALGQTITASIYQSGTNISCFGLSDGSIDLTITGGSPGYLYSWNNGATSQDLTGLPSGTYNVTVTDVNGCSIPSSIILIQPVLLTSNTVAFVYPGGFNVSGCSPDGSVDLTVAGGNPGYTYLWSNGSTTQDISLLNAGVYSVTVTDINGCQTLSSVTLTQPLVLAQSISAFVYPGGTNISCFGYSDGSIDLTITGGVSPYTYLWNNGMTNQDLSNVPFGVYSVTITDQNGCQITSTITLNQPLAISQSISAFVYPGGSNISCFGLNDGSIDLTVNGGNSGYTYLWNTGATTQDLSSLTAGNYSVIVTDITGCTIPSSITLIEPPLLTENTSSPTFVGGNNISCFGLSDGSIDLSVGGGSAGYTYLWSTGATTEDISGLPIGTYNVTITDINGCQVIGNITLTEPTPLSYSETLSIVAGGYNVTGCANDGTIDLTVSGSIPGYIYSWSNGLPTEDASNLAGGTYIVTITDANGCQLVVDTTLTASPTVNALTSVVSNYNGQDISCFGASDGSITVVPSGGAPGYTYQWTDAASNPISTNQTPTNLPSGIYNIIVSDQNGCTFVTTATLVDPPIFNFTIAVSTNYNGQDISCFGASDGGIDLVVAGATPGYTYIWTDIAGINFSTIEDPNGLPAGIYDVLTTDANGCTFETSIVLTEPPILMGVADVLSDYNGEDVSCFNSTDGIITVVSSGGTPTYAYQWVDDNGNIIGSNVDQNNVGEGIYQVEITDLNGCTFIAPVVVTQPEILFTAPIIISNYFGQAVSCEGATDGIVDAFISGGTPVYAYSWNSNPVVTVNPATNLGVGTYTFTVTDANGCIASDNVTLTANPIPTYTIPPPIYGCLGDEVVLNSNVEPGSSCTWVFSDGQVINDCGPFTATFPNQDCYDLQYSVINALGCVNSTSVTEYICITPNPLAGFYADEYEITNIENGINFWNTSVGADSYSWSFGDESQNETGFNEYHEFLGGSDAESTSFQIILYAMTEFGCIDSAVRYVNMNPDILIYVPNTFTPDNDAFNPIFQPILTAGFDPYSYTLLIFNRWGEVIFESHDSSKGWDGSYGSNGEINIVQDGTFTWKIEFKTSFDDERRMMIGHVNVIR